MTEAQRITEELRGRWHGRYGAAPYPICQPEGRRDQNALTLTDGESGRLLAFCRKAGCRFMDLLDALRSLGIIEGRGAVPQADPAEMARYQAEQRREAEKRERQARTIWAETRPISGTIAETYLRGARGIICDLPGSLRFHPACWHGATAQRLPALVAAVVGGDRFDIHRTYVRADGMGKAEVNPPKAMLGAVMGGAVQLAEGPDALAVAEGIESALSLLCGPLKGAVAVWAALSASGMSGLRLPTAPGALIVATDGDDAGRTAGNALAFRAASLGWTITLFPASEGRDWNDVVLQKGTAK